MWSTERMKAAIQIKVLRDAGFSNKDIIEAKKAGLIEELVSE